MAGPAEAASEQKTSYLHPNTDTVPSQSILSSNVRYIAIRPKPPEPPQPAKLPIVRRLQTPSFRASPSRRKCSVPPCNLPDCTLQTHINYGRYRAQAAHQRGLPNFKTSRTPSPLPERGLSGLPELALPLGESPPNIYRALFNDFFSTIYDRVVVVLSPPPSSAQQKAKAANHKKAMLHRSMESPLYSLNYVAGALIARRTASQAHDAVVLTLAGKLMKLLREKLANFSTGEVDHLLVIILTLVMLDTAANDYTNLHVHRAGMALLVNTRGGIHNLGSSMLYAISLDRLIAIYTSKPPLYIPRQNRSMRRPHRFEHIYGAFFDSPSADLAKLPSEVIDYCQDICRTIELFEGQGISFDPKSVGETNSTDSHYFYFMRNRLADEFSHLNAIYSEGQGVVKCILLAAKIVDYLVLTDNYISTIPVFLAGKIRHCLELQNVEEDWAGLEGALGWVQWTMACVCAMNEESYQETLSFLVDRAEAMYRQLPFPLDWNDQGLQFDCVRNFVWASSLDEKLARVCNDEDAMLRKRLVNVIQSTPISTTEAKSVSKGKKKVK